jgi:hypothetical protein
MSRRWRGLLSTTSHEVNIGEIDQEYLDLAGKYAALLEAMHAKSLNEPDMPTENLFQFDIASDLSAIKSQLLTSHLTMPTSSETNHNPLSRVVDGYSAVDGNLATMWGAPTPGVDPGQVSDQVERSISPYTNDSGKLFDSPLSLRSMSGTGTISGNNTSHTHGILPAMTPLTNLHRLPPHLTQGSMVDPISNNNTALGDEVSEMTQDELAVITKGLLDENFSALDRVITLDGTDFNFDLSYWSTD